MSERTMEIITEMLNAEMRHRSIWGTGQSVDADLEELKIAFEQLKKVFENQTS